MTTREPFEEPAEEGAFDDLPSTDIDVENYIHFGMAGSFPLRLADLFFAEDGLHIVEYSYITVMFGLGTGKHRREAKAMKAVYDTHGIDEVRLRGDKSIWLNYGGIDRVVLDRGGGLGRPKLTVYAADGESYAYRVHESGGDGREDTAALLADLEASAAAHDVELEVRDGFGFRPAESIHRFIR
ncbi:MAG: hypothetical protein ABEJ34_04810 [Haloferacaceae archaeon]